MCQTRFSFRCFLSRTLKGNSVILLNMAAMQSPFLSHVGQSGTQEKMEREKAVVKLIHRSAYRENDKGRRKGERNTKGKGPFIFFLHCDKGKVSLKIFNSVIIYKYV